MNKPHLLLCLLLSGCFWITDGDHADRMDLDGDGLRYDEDCDDSDAAVGAASTWYADTDGDGWGSEGAEIVACEQPTGAVEQAGDCDDGDPGIFPGAVELCDGFDNDCDELIDGEDEVADATDWYPDADGDGYGDCAAEPVSACEQPSGTTGEELAIDCEDDDPDSYPGAPELCDGIDNDQDGEIDEDAVDALTFYLDGDGDGYGLDDSSIEACELPGGYAAQAGDCDDGDAAFNPGAVEDDCSDPNDYNCDGSTGYADEDGDGWAACEECDDTDASIHPGAPEYCDGADNDCDTDIDEDAVDGATWYLDGDGDGFGDASASVQACEQPSGYEDDDDDCDDADAAVYPGASELCNGVDDDCNGLVDEDDPALSDAPDWYPDADGDGYGDMDAAAVAACEQPTDHVADHSDCDDADASVSPGADERSRDACFDGVDNDCDGGVDDEDGDCAACPYPCTAEVCLYVDGVLEAEQSTALSGAMADIDSLVLTDASFDRVLLGAAGTVVVHEDFEASLGCFTVGTLGSGVLEAGEAAACAFSDVDLSGGDWVVSVDLLSGAGDASLALMDSFSTGSTWYDFVSAPVLDDGDGTAIAFGHGVPDPRLDHHVVMCGATP